MNGYNVLTTDVSKEGGLLTFLANAGEVTLTPGANVVQNSATNQTKVEMASSFADAEIMLGNQQENNNVNLEVGDYSINETSARNVLNCYSAQNLQFLKHINCEFI